MAKKTVCDICDGVIKDGENAGLKNAIFTWGPHLKASGGSHPVIDPIRLDHSDRPEVQVTTAVRVNGKSDPDICLPCLKRAVAEA